MADEIKAASITRKMPDDVQVAEAKWIDALLAEGSAAEKCFCDTQYPDSNRDATCGDCPRDYEGSASSEGTEEAVAWMADDGTGRVIDAKAKMAGERST